MKEYAKVKKWDTRLRIAFEVICCTFMLDCIERISECKECHFLFLSCYEKNGRPRALGPRGYHKFCFAVLVNILLFVFLIVGYIILVFIYLEL